MHVCILSVELHLPMAQSLKAKRSIVQSIVRTVDGWTSVASAEVGFVDKWQRAHLGFAVVSGDRRHANSMLDSIAEFVEGSAEAVVMNRSTELVSLGDLGGWVG